MSDKNTKKSRRQEDDESTALALPKQHLSSIFEDFMRPFDEFMAPFFPRSLRSFWPEFGGREPNIDIQDRGDHYVMTAELPGFEKKDVEVQVTPNALELKAEKRSQNESASDDNRRSQSSYSYVHKYVSLPETVLSERVDGTMKNGVLELKLPKAEPKPMGKSRKVDLK